MIAGLLWKSAEKMAHQCPIDDLGEYLKCRKRAASYFLLVALKWWRDPESNRGHKDFQSSALPTELSRPAFLSRVLLEKIPDNRRAAYSVNDHFREIELVKANGSNSGP